MILTVIVVVTHDDLLRLAIFAHLAPEILVESIEVVLELTGIHLVFWIVCRILVQIWQEDCLRVGGFDVFSRAAVAMAAGADFVVEGTIDFVLLSAKDRGEVVSHDGYAQERSGVSVIVIVRACSFLAKNVSTV